MLSFNRGEYNAFHPEYQALVHRESGTGPYHSDTLTSLIAEDRIFPTEVHAGGFQAKKKRTFSLIYKKISQNLTLGGTQTRAKNSLLKPKTNTFISES